MFGDPINYLDPTGTDAWSAAAAFAQGFAVGVVGGAVVTGLVVSGGALAVAGTALAVAGAFSAGLEIGQLITGTGLDGVGICVSDRIDRAARLAGGLLGAGLGSRAVLDLQAALET